MKNVVLTIVVGAMIASSLGSCKKGENDPFLSLRSRKARVAGDWNVSEAKTISTSNTNLKEIFDVQGGKMVKTDSSSLGVTKYNGEVKQYFFSIEKDGSFIIGIDVSYDLGDAQSISYTLHQEGVWNFVLKNKHNDIKNKERIVFHITREVEQTIQRDGVSVTGEDLYDDSYEIGSYSRTYQIDELRNKKMVLSKVSSYTFKSELNESHYEGDEKIVLEQ